MPRRSKFKREQDLVYIAQAYLTGKPQAEIAQELNVSQPTITHDLKELQRRWLAASVRDIDQLKAQELAKIDNLERTYWEAWARSCEDATTQVKRARKGTGDETVVQEQRVTVQEQVGDPRFLTGIQWCIERRCKVLGFDAPIAQTHSGDVTFRVVFAEDHAAASATED